jgi:hypothetical protein
MEMLVSENLKSDENEELIWLKTVCLTFKQPMLVYVNACKENTPRN